MLFEESLFVLLMPDVLLHGGLFHALSLIVGARGHEDAVHLGPQADVFRNGSPGALILHLAQHLLVHRAEQRVVFRQVRRVIEIKMLGHILVHILRLDLKEQTVSVCVEELTALTISHLELAVIEVAHQVLGEVKDAHPHIHRSIEDQTALVHLDPCQIIVEDVRSGKGWAEFVLLMRAHQFDINPLPQVLHGLPEDRVVHELVEVLLEVAGSPFSELCVHPDVGLHPGALPEAEGPVDLRELHAQREVELQVAIVEYIAVLVAEVLPASVVQLDAPSDWRPGGRGFNPRRGRQHSFVEIDHEIFSTVILSLPLIQEGQLSVSGERMCTILVNRLED